MPDKPSLSKIHEAEGDLRLSVDRPRLTRADRIRHQLLRLLYEDCGELELHELLSRSGGHWVEVSELIRSRPDYFTWIEREAGPSVRLAWFTAESVQAAKWRQARSKYNRKQRRGAA